MTRPKSKQSPPPPSSSPSEGYCHSCGRLLPRENKSDPTPRKYCSSTCKTHSKSSNLRDIRLKLTRAYHYSLNDARNPRGNVVLCSEAEKLVFAGLNAAPNDESINNNNNNKNENQNNDNVQTLSNPPVPAQLSQAEQREESRRAARRLVAFGFSTQGIPDENRLVEAVQNGKNVETSFAKGEWGIRWK